VNLPSADPLSDAKESCQVSKGFRIHSSNGNRPPFLLQEPYRCRIGVLPGSFMTSGNEAGSPLALSLHERNVIVLANTLEHEKRR
jgi:hypothetical protein